MADTTTINQASAESRFNNLDMVRHATLDRARAAAELTLPSIMPPTGATEETALDTPFQGLGAQGVSTVSAKLLQSLLPIQTAFFNLQVDEAVLAENEEQREAITKKMMESEKILLQDIESEGLRIPTFAALKNLVVTGNALLFIPDKGKGKSYRLDQFVVLRDGEGNVLEVLIKEMIAPEALPKAVADQLSGQLDKAKLQGENSKGKQTDIAVFTWVKRVDGMMKAHQEILGTKIDKSESSYPVDESPWIVMRWSALPGENYGRGLVEELYGDLKSLEGYYRALVKGTAAALKMVYMVNPAGVTRPEHLARASTGDIVRGREEDVSVLRADKGQDFQSALAMVDIIEKRLKASFLMTAGVTRNAERVTAEEIRLLAAELEAGLGGVFSIMSQEFQNPFLARLMRRATKAGRMPAFPKGVVFPKIVTGLDALGRGQNLEKLLAWKQTLEGVPGAVEAINGINFGNRAAQALGIDVDGLMITQEEQQQQQQQQQMADAGSAALPGVAKEAAAGMVQQRLADNQAEQGQ